MVKGPLNTYISWTVGQIHNISGVGLQYSLLVNDHMTDNTVHPSSEEFCPDSFYFVAGLFFIPPVSIFMLMYCKYISTASLYMYHR